MLELLIMIIIIFIFTLILNDIIFSTGDIKIQFEHIILIFSYTILCKEFMDKIL